MKLHEYPFDRVQVACEKCERRGSYRKSALAERFGVSIELPDMLKEIATNCPRQGHQSVAIDPCGVIYPDLRITPYTTDFSWNKPTNFMEHAGWLADMEIK